MAWLRCVVCGRRLTDAASTDTGYEQHCAENVTEEFLEVRKRGVRRMEESRLTEARRLARLNRAVTDASDDPAI